MPIVKASEVAYCRFQVSDLDLAEQFLVDFGLLPAGRDKDGRRYFRGTDPHSYCYVIQKGEDHFLGFAFYAKSRGDLDALAAATGAKVETIDGPGGGERVRLQEPNGYDVDLVFGIEPAEEVKIPRQVMNSVSQPLARANELLRMKKNAPTPVRRLAHVVLSSPRHIETINWFKQTFGTLSSDDIITGPEKELIGAFMRVDDGEKHVDHHAVFVIKSPKAGLNHVSFEVQDMEAIFQDHYYLKSLDRHEHLWGIGRHLLGSQVYDYWSDPFGYTHEHWADTDRLTADIPPNVWEAQIGFVSQWGEEPPLRFREGTKARGFALQPALGFACAGI